MQSTRTFRTSEAPIGVLRAIRCLLGHAFAGDFSDDDWQHTLGGWHVVVVESASAIAHAAVVERTLHVDGEAFRTGYVEGVATAPRWRGQGIGTRALSRLMDVLRDEFDFGALSTAQHGFYERLGWERWCGPTFVRRGPQLVRTADDDGAVMVLRFDRSRAVDLSAAIACDARAGDDW